MKSGAHLGLPLLALFVSCAQEPLTRPSQANLDPNTLRQLEFALEQQSNVITHLQTELSAQNRALLEAQVQASNRHLELIELMSKTLRDSDAAGGVKRAVVLDPHQSGLTAVFTSNALLLVSCAEIRAGGGETTLRLKVGNPLQATVHGYECLVRYGAPPPLSGSVPGTNFVGRHRDLATWRRELRVASAKSHTPLEAGEWSHLEIILPDIQPEELGYLQATMETPAIGLRPAP